MGTIFIEGFDKYGPPNTATAFTPFLYGMSNWGWVGTAPNFNIKPGLAGLGGGAIQIGPQILPRSIALTRGFQQNAPRVIGGCRFTSNLDGDCAFVFYDGPTPQVYLFVLNTTGLISLYPGNVYTAPGYPNNPPIAASAASVGANTSHMIEWDISFGPASAYNIYLDGVNILSGIGNTQQSANAWANTFSFYVHAGFGGSTFVLDDVYFFDGTGAYNNAVLLSNPVVYTDFPIADHLKQFTNVGNVVGNYIGVDPLDASTPYSSEQHVTLNAAQLYVQPATPIVNCTINSVNVSMGVPTPTGAGTANFKAVLYSDSSNHPGTLLSGGTQVTGYSPGTILTLPLTTPTALTAGTQYWIGFIFDTQTIFQCADYPDGSAQFSGGLTFNGQVAANTYASGAPSTAPAMTSGQRTIGLYGACTGAATNWQSEALNHPPLSGVAGVQSNTIAIEDLYQYPGLPSSIGTVHTVCVSGNTFVAGAGIRRYNLLALSGATTGNGSRSNIQAISNQTWGESYFDTDPATGVPWTPTAVSNGFYGMIITA